MDLGRRERYPRHHVSLGDVDDDGDLDVVFGNEGEANTLFLNEGGSFQSTPAWSSEPTNGTVAISLGDVDGDGDLDLFCGNAGSGNTLYLNEGGSLQTSPVWSSGSSSPTRTAFRD